MTTTGRRRIAAVSAAGMLMATGWIAHPVAVTLQTAAPITLSIVGTNDLHGGVLQKDDRGGLALLAGYVNILRAERARDGGAVLLIDGGDMFQGTLESNLTEGAAVVAAYDAMGYAAAAIGNHDFDFGPVGPAATPQSPADDPRGALKARAAAAAFPFLAANLIDTATGVPVAWPHVQPSVVVRAAGVSVGIVGVMTKDALTATIAANTRGLRVAPAAPAIAAEAARLRGAGATVVIVAAHIGGRCSRFDQPADVSSCDADAEIVDVARGLPAGLVDAIIAGHTHAGMAHLIEAIPVTESFSGGRSFGRVDLMVDRATHRVTGSRLFSPRDICAREETSTHACGPVAGRSDVRVPARYDGEAVTPDARIEAILAPALQSVRDLKASRLGVFLETAVRRRGVESALGNLFTDAFRESTLGADVAINNTDGGLRADLPAGALTYGSLFEVFPFDNRIVKLTLSGGDLRRVLTAQLRQRGLAVGISGIRVQAVCAADRLVVTLLTTSGRAIRDDERVVVATTDFLATGGDAVFAPVMPPQGFSTADDGPLARDLVADWLRRRGGRVREDQLVDLAHPRWAYPGSLPVRCGPQASQ